MKRMLLVLLVVIVASIMVACATGPSWKSALALAEREAGGKTIYWFGDDHRPITALVCANNEIVPVVVRGTAMEPSVTKLSDRIGICGEPETLWTNYEAALRSNVYNPGKLDRIKSAMQALKDEIE